MNTGQQRLRACGGRKLNDFSNYVVQDMEQADQTITISVVTLLLIIILIVLIV